METSHNVRTSFLDFVHFEESTTKKKKEHILETMRKEGEVLLIWVQQKQPVLLGSVSSPLCVCENWKWYVVKHNCVN